MQGNNVRMSKCFEYLDFAVEIFLELLIESFEIDGFDGYGSFGFLDFFLY